MSGFHAQYLLPTTCFAMSIRCRRPGFNKLSAARKRIVAVGFTAWWHAAVFVRHRNYTCRLTLGGYGVGFVRRSAGRVTFGQLFIYKFVVLSTQHLCNLCPLNSTVQLSMHVFRIWLRPEAGAYISRVSGYVYCT